jgi:hypothetical protein
VRYIACSHPFFENNARPGHFGAWCVKVEAKVIAAWPVLRL